MTAHEFTVGQKLWYVPHDNNYINPFEVTIIKIARKWVALSHGMRMNIHTMWIDGGSYPSPGRCYISKDSYGSYVRAQKIWSALASKVGYRNMPCYITEAKARQAAAILGIELGVID